MNFNELKPIFAEKTFNILANLLDNPTCDIYLPNLADIDSTSPFFDPFEDAESDITSVASGEPTFIQNIRCIYTYDKLFVQENDVQLGSSYTLIIYLRSDDIDERVKDVSTNIIIKFNNIMYTVSTHLNLYNILHEFSLK